MCAHLARVTGAVLLIANIRLEDQEYTPDTECACTIVHIGGTRSSEIPSRNFGYTLDLGLESLFHDPPPLPPCFLTGSVPNSTHENIPTHIHNSEKNATRKLKGELPKDGSIDLINNHDIPTDIATAIRRPSRSRKHFSVKPYGYNELHATYHTAVGCFIFMTKIGVMILNPRFLAYYKLCISGYPCTICRSLLMAPSLVS